jgi:hypothetical protein
LKWQGGLGTAVKFALADVLRRNALGLIRSALDDPAGMSRNMQSLETTGIESDFRT